MEQDFNVKIAGVDAAEVHKDEEEILTAEQLDLSYQKKVKQAIDSFQPDKRLASTYLKDDSTVSGVDYDQLEQLSASPQSDLTKVQSIINIVRQQININDILGITDEVVENNINTEIRLSYKRAKKGVRSKSDIEAVKALITDFNEKINLSGLITKAVSTAWRDGNFIACLRRKDEQTENPDYVVDYYPLGVAIVSDYEFGGQPAVLISITELKSRLQKQYPKNRKRKGIFYDNMEAEIKAAYPDVVYQAYKNNEQYAKIPVEMSCVIRTNSQGKKYGLPSAFRSLPSILMLDAFAKADRVNAKARAKKMIVQLMHKEILGPEYSRNAYDVMAFAQKNFVEAFSQSTCVLTAPPTVSEVAYVEPSAPMTDIELINMYRSRVMTTLGVSFYLDSDSQSLSTANISVKQLLRNIGKISKQLEVVLEKWYKVVIRDAGLDVALAPSISIIDAEMMEMSMKKELVDLLYNKLNFSLDTCSNILGFSIEDERTKREAENKEKIDENVFYPRLNAYTASGSSGSSGGSGSGGRTPSEEPNNENKQTYDRERYKALTGKE